MSKIISFRDLDAWKKSHGLRLAIIKQLVTFPKEYQFGLCSQLQRSSISISSNIAEGFGRTSYKEKLQFYSIAEGSLTEAQDQIILARDLGLLQDTIAEKLLSESEEVHKLIHGMMRYVRNTKN